MSGPTISALWTPAIPASLTTDSTVPLTVGTMFETTEPCTLAAIWFWSDTGATVLPDNVAVYVVSDQSQVVLNSSPSWSGAAGSGWVRCDMSSYGITLNGIYMMAVGASTAGQWLSYTDSYFSSGPGAGGITNGILAAFNSTGGNTGPYATSDIAYPAVAGAFARNWWIDVEVYAGAGSFSTAVPLGAASKSPAYGDLVVSNDVWNTGPAGPQMVWAVSGAYWGASSQQGGSDLTSVKSYPNVSWPANPPGTALVLSYPGISAAFSCTRPSSGSWVGDVGFDCWLNNYAIEVLFVVDNQGQAPAGTIVGTYVSGGHTWTVRQLTAGTHYDIVIDTYTDSGAIDLLAGFKWLIDNGYIASSVLLAAINFGSEFCSTADTPMSFTVTDFSLAFAPLQSGGSAAWIPVVA